MSSRTNGRTRIVAGALTFLLLGLLIRAMILRNTPVDLLWMMALGVFLGSVYVLRGSLPASIVNRENDPRNIPVRFYLPIILIAVLVAGGLLAWALRRH